jgi:hypothetical protein
MAFFPKFEEVLLLNLADGREHEIVTLRLKMAPTDD